MLRVRLGLAPLTDKQLILTKFHDRFLVVGQSLSVNNNTAEGHHKTGSCAILAFVSVTGEWNYHNASTDIRTYQRDIINYKSTTEQSTRKQSSRDPQVSL